MTYTQRDLAPELEPTLFAAAWRYRWLVVITVIAFGALGWVYAKTRPVAWSATAKIVVEDPQASSLFDSGASQRPDRYVQDQAEIIRSQEVAQKAAESELNQTLPLPLGVGDLFDDIDVGTDRDSDVISVSYTAPSLATALAAVNATAEAYREVRASQAAESFAAAIDQIETSIELRKADLDALQTSIDTIRASSPRVGELDRQYEDALALLVAAQNELDVERQVPLELDAEGVPIPNPRVAELRSTLDDLLQELQTLQVVRAIENDRPELSPLVEEQIQAVRRIAELQSVREQLLVDAELAGTGVRLLPAQEGSRAGSGPVTSAVIFAFFGGLVGAGFAYYLSLRRRRFEHAGQPAAVLGAPLIAEVPTFRQEGIKSPLPVRAAPRSASAEAFRFAASGLFSKRDRPEGGDIPTATTIAVTSAKVGEGKSVVAANTALAVAREGKRVLLIDGDFGNQMSSAFLVPDVRPEIGLTEVVEEGRPLSDAVIQAESLTESAGLHVLARGWRPSSAPEFFRLPATRAFMQRVAESYDLVIIDTPPLLQVAYASTIADLADGVLIVVPHLGPVGDLEQVVGRLALLGRTAVGYVYNLAPLRAEMIMSHGSMQDILGQEQPPVRRVDTPASGGMDYLS